MSEAALPTARIALVGNPNTGKTALFNALTGSRQKVANYAGVTVERKEGFAHTAGGRTSRNRAASRATTQDGLRCRSAQSVSRTNPARTGDEARYRESSAPAPHGEKTVASMG